MSELEYDKETKPVDAEPWKQPPFCVECGESKYVCEAIKASGAFPTCCPKCTHNPSAMDVVNQALTDAGINMEPEIEIEYSTVYDILREYSVANSFNFLESSLDDVAHRIYDLIYMDY